MQMYNSVPFQVHLRTELSAEIFFDSDFLLQTDRARTVREGPGNEAAPYILLKRFPSSGLSPRQTVNSGGRMDDTVPSRLKVKSLRAGHIKKRWARKGFSRGNILLMACFNSDA